jgi:putative Mg2+ transporter-C (MgtC) family protein
MLLAQLHESFIFDSWPAEAVLRLLVASVLGALIGLDREHRGQAAGLRTQLLVALGAALAMVTSLHFVVLYGRETGAMRIDPSRVVYGVMTGLGFLGAGTIIKYSDGTRVRGLTTAASVWCSGAIGLASGLGMFLVSVVTAGVVLFALLLLDRLEARIPTRHIRRLILTVPGTSPDAIGRFSDIITRGGGRIREVDFSNDIPAGRSTLDFSVEIPAPSVAELTKAIMAAAPDLIGVSMK